MVHAKYTQWFWLTSLLAKRKELEKTVVEVDWLGQTLTSSAIDHELLCSHSFCFASMNQRNLYILLFSDHLCEWDFDTISVRNRTASIIIATRIDAPVSQPVDKWLMTDVPISRESNKSWAWTSHFASIASRHIYELFGIAVVWTGLTETRPLKKVSNAFQY